MNMNFNQMYQNLGIQIGTALLNCCPGRLDLYFIGAFCQNLFRVLFR